MSVWLDHIGFGIVIPLLPFYAESFGASPTVIGMLIGLYSLMQLFSPALWGSLSDYIGRRLALLLNIAGTGLSFLLFGLAQSLWMLFAARALSGATGASIVIAQSYIADITTPENRASRLGFLEAAVILGFILGPVVGSALAGRGGAVNFGSPGLAAALLSLFTFCLAFIALPKQKSRPSRLTKWNTQALLTNLVGVLQRPMVGQLMVVAFCAMSALVACQATIALWCEYRFGWGFKEFSYFIIFSGLLSACAQIALTGPLTRWFGEVNILFAGLVGMGLGLLLLPFSTSLPLLLGAMAFVICGQALSSPTNTSLLCQLAGVKQQGKTLGLAQSVAGLASFTGAIWGGFMFEAIGPGAPYWGGALLILGAIAFGKRQITGV
ncbi:MAG: MFS transporter [Moorea sp. SIO2I5]|nr:MFS transporter [Moorena sp. SIO2I5]